MLYARLMGAVAYLRISSDPDDQRTGIERQRETVDRIAARLGVEIEEYYVDNDVTAGSLKVKRKDFRRMLAELPTRRPTHILSWEWARLSRSDYRDVGDLEAACEEYEITVVLDKGPLDWNSGETAAMVMVARMESKEARKRARAFQESRRSHGHAGNGGKRSYGYTYQMDIVDAESDVIHEVAERVVRGETTRSIVDSLNGRGLRLPGGGPFTQGGLRRIMTAPRLVGDNVHRGEVIGQGAWDAILDRATFEAVRAVYDTKNGGGEKGATSLLAGLVRCGRCGERMVAHTQHVKGRKILAYRCDRSKGGCGLVRNRAKLDALVIEVAGQLMPPAEISDVDVDDITERLASIDARQRETREAFAGGVISLTDAAPILDDLRAQRAAVERELGQARRVETVAVEGLARFCDMTVAEQRAWLKTQLSVVVVNEAGVNGGPRRGRYAGFGIGTDIDFIDTRGVRFSDWWTDRSASAEDVAETV